MDNLKYIARQLEIILRTHEAANEAAGLKNEVVQICAASLYRWMEAIKKYTESP